ncbi:MAG: DegT/DnrJ/EryC1/StrS family aminotransferase [Candidatus Omnitrophica bacterium]|nr:DegT/DnrJ/EryC1/StrS family aminotransferase [Candidatus Omnitrophota bacterium]
MQTVKSSGKIPPLDLVREYEEIGPAIQTRVDRVLRSGQFILGKEVEEFEKRFAQFYGAKFSVGVASGSDALLLPLLEMGIQPGDEVMTTAWTFIATAGAILRVGAVPRFVDIEHSSFTINVDLLEKVLTPKTRAIMPVHIYGHPADMSRVMVFARKHQLTVIEDCAQALGAQWGEKRVGTFGEFGAFSFYPTKNLGAYGDAGAIVTNDEKFAKKLRELRTHGAERGYLYEDKIGINSRLDEIQAAVLNVKLDRLSRWNDARISAAAYYTERLGRFNLPNLILPSEKSGAYHVYHLYTIRTKDRDKLADFLNKRGIAAGIYYPLPIHRQKAFLKLGFGEISLPETERAAREVLSLPLFPQILREEQDSVIDAVGDYFKR